jgi:nucleoporin NUP82
LTFFTIHDEVERDVITMTQDDWSAILDEHPIFALPNSIGGLAGQLEESLELSTNTLMKSSLEEDGLSLSGRRQVMALKDSDLIVAAGCELRITSLSNSKLGRNTNKSFKVRFPTLPTHDACP